MDNTEINVNFKDIKLLEWIGGGGFGEVHKGIWRIHGQKTDIAVKITTYDYRNEKNKDKIAVFRKIENLQKCIHPNIIRLYGVSKTSDNRICFILEYADCGSLYEFLHRTKREASFSERIDWMLQCAKALKYLHRKKIVHRSLSTRNLLLFDKYRVLKISDIYQVKKFRIVPDPYLAPEYWDTNEIYTEKCNIFSFGIIFLEVMFRKWLNNGKT
ncbi:mitogen-activated protein kinase kinase kinase 7-like [Drosophila sulfurigaster albostrigata]|uniref:mitogen-activated protein kinase kinase kinase 7-like n=1 Tax=Drosophila sulfurigaster albostrigata TaxID=89887 RepID=UPI002D21D6B1|nr:mitogen-activated protein kinase kinase kinase 7-like [Drosophila sulfurigaster albostrigata]